MQPGNAAHDLERIAKAFRLISKEISSGGLGNALHGVAIGKFRSRSRQCAAERRASRQGQRQLSTGKGAETCLFSLQTTWRNATRQTQRVRPRSEERRVGKE